MRLFLGLYAAVFSFVLIRVLFFSAYHFSAPLQLGLLVLWVGILAMLGIAGTHYAELLARRRTLVLVACLGFIFLVQLWVGIVTRQQPIHDYGKVFNGAVIFATEGDSEDFLVYNNYFHHFTNNAVPFVFLQAVYRLLALVGFSDFYGFSVVMGHLIFTVTILFTFLYLETAFGLKAAFYSLLLYMAFLPVYFQSSVFYTDTLSVWAPAALLYLNERAKKSTKKNGRLLCYALMGLVLAVGANIKATVLICGIAILIEAFINGNPKRILSMVLVVSLTGGLAAAGISSLKYAVILDRDRVAEEAVPVTYWIMMGLQGDGSYNPSDKWDITMSVEGKEARTALNIAVIRQRLSDMGFWGWLQLLWRKIGNTFGCGNAEIHYTLTLGPDNPAHWIYRFISLEGDWFAVFCDLSQCVYLSFLLLGVTGAVTAFRRLAAAFRRNTAPYIALLGFFAFMMLWESNYRQLINQWPLLISVAAVGASQLPDFAGASLARLKGHSARTAERMQE